MFASIFHFFDKLEDKVRSRLSRKPIAYAFIAGAGIIIFWRGVWHTTDFVMQSSFSILYPDSSTSLGAFMWWDGPLSIVIGAVLLLMTGAFVSSFIGSEIIITGIKGEKKLTEKTEAELEASESVVEHVKKEVDEMTKKLEEIEEELKKKNK
jgi:hypothetical protein